MNDFEPGFLQKLFDDKPHSQSVATFKKVSLEQMKDSVARDLEALLNSRNMVDDTVLQGLPQSQHSLITYGLKDFSALSLASSHDRACICRSLEHAITTHEVRLRDVVVALQIDDRKLYGLHFLVRATLLIHPAAEPVSFDAMLQPSTLQYSVNRASVGTH